MKIIKELTRIEFKKTKTRGFRHFENCQKNIFLFLAFQKANHKYVQYLKGVVWKIINENSFID